MPTRDEIREQFAQLVHEVAGTVGADQVQFGRRLADDLGVDSLALADIFLGAEEHFGITIPDELSSRVQTVDEAVELIISSFENSQSSAG